MKQIKLTQNQFALVDDDDFEWLSHRKWYAHFDKNYANGGAYKALCNSFTVMGKRKTLYMHREIIARLLDRKLNQCEMIDHINGNTLDNQRSNLRIASPAQNQYNRNKAKNNTSGFKGVTWSKFHNKWVAQIKINKKHIHIGYFNDIQSAAKAYNQAALDLHGDYANINNEVHHED